MVTSSPQVMRTEPSRYGSSTTLHLFINSDANTRSQILLLVPITGGCMISEDLSVTYGNPTCSFACLTLISPEARPRVIPGVPYCHQPCQKQKQILWTPLPHSLPD